METPIVYVICDKNCKFEGMTKEQIYTAILQAVNEGTIGNIDAGFVTTIKTINGLPLKFFVGEQAAYDELTAEDKENLFAIITNDTTKEGIIQAITDLRIELEGLINNLLSGEFVVGKAAYLRSFVLNSYEDLLNILEEHSYYGTYAIAINENEISLPNSAGKLPVWHSGIMVADHDVSLTLTGRDGNIVSVYYDRTGDTWSVQTLKQKPDEASRADEASYADTALYVELSEEAIECEKDLCLLYAGLYCIEIDGCETVMLSFKSQSESTRSSLAPDGAYVRWNTTDGLLEAVNINETYPITEHDITRVICIARYNF